MKATAFKFIARVTLAVALSSSSLANASTPDAPRLGELVPSLDRKTLKQQEAAGRDKLRVLLDNPAGQDIQLIRANPAIVSEATKLFSVPLPDGRQPKFQLRHYTPPESPSDSGVPGKRPKYTPAAYWFGYKEPDEKAPSPIASSDNVDASNFIFLARRGDSLRGRMVVNGQLYLLEDVGNGQHGFMKIDEAQGLPCMVLENEPNGQEHATGAISPVSDIKAEHEIGVLLVTTQRANELTNPSAVDIMMDEIRYFSEMGNQGYGLSLKLNVASPFASEAQDSAGHASKDILDDFRNMKTPATQHVAELRESARADVVIVGAYNVEAKEVTYQEARKDTAFYVFNVKAPQYFFHGFGHLMGVRHVWKDGDMDLDPPYQHGFLSKEFEGKCYASIGFDPIDCVAPGCEIIHRWSDPNLNMRFGRFGDPQHSDEIRYLNERAAEIESFY
ncbi:hypothetical protein HU751_017005 [Pseudomonas sp. BW13M1]|uniref:Uncharacterized protein n=1 Tax=Pseudomonas peradeniyensis TaxID=2745488 RepID=A0A923G517_9PSED|nr:hypothetical protein [Pseudomonas peradeniyensis]MBV4506547.1 hypothetical protein [Pseudomonas peradeniyensis]